MSVTTILMFSHSCSFPHLRFAAMMTVIPPWGLEETLNFAIANLKFVISSISISIFSHSLCVRAFKWEFVCKGHYWKRRRPREDVQQERLPAPGTPSKTTRQGTEGEKDMKVRQGDGDKRGLVLQGIWPVWKGQMFPAHRRNVHRYILLHLRLQTYFSWAGLVLFSFSPHISSCLLCTLIKPLFQGSYRVTHSPSAGDTLAMSFFLVSMRQQVDQAFSLKVSRYLWFIGSLFAQQGVWVAPIVIWFYYVLGYQNKWVVSTQHS